MHAIVDLYCPVTAGGDGVTDGQILGYYSERALAIKAGHKRDGWGNDCQIKVVKAILADDMYYLLASTEVIDVNGKIAERKQKLREEAIALLSPEQLEALGVKL